MEEVVAVEVVVPHVETAVVEEKGDVVVGDVVVPAAQVPKGEEKKKEEVKQHKVQYYKGKLSSPFALEVLSKMSKGFQPLPEGSKEPWSVSLFHRKNCFVKASSLRKMQDWQRHSRFPKAEHLTQKSKLAKSFRKMMKKGATDLDFLPQTFVLPDDWKSFLKFSGKEKRNVAGKGKGKGKEEEKEQVRGPWIIKPHDAAGGHGIMIVPRLSDLGYLELAQLVSKWKKIVVSQYIMNPLLIDGLKFDLRLYVLVTSFTPLHIFFFSEGLARFCTEKYPTDGNIANLLAHLTNTSLNCHSDKFVYSDDINDQTTGHTRSFSSVLQHLGNEGVDTNKLMDDIYKLTIKTFETIQPKVEKAIKDNVPHKRNCFHLFGLDVLLDENLKPWLLEVNGNPCLEPYISMEVPIKARLVRDMFRTVGLFETKRKKREMRRKGDFVLICPTSIKSRTHRKRSTETTTSTTNNKTTEVPIPTEVIPVTKEEVVVEKKLDEPANGAQEVIAQPVMVACM